MANISNSLGHLRRRTPTKNERPRKTSSGLEHPHRGAKCAFYREKEREEVSAETKLVCARGSAQLRGKSEDNEGVSPRAE